VSFLWSKKEVTERKEEEMKERERKKEKKDGKQSTYSVPETNSSLTSRR
jgi:hypothetical protein